MRTALYLLPALFTVSVHAATPSELMKGYSADAARQQPGFTPSGPQGAAFYARRFGVSNKMPACTSCHTDDPTKPGSHVVTNKPIKPLAPSANPERFTDQAKADKWFVRNCKEVVGRDCTAAEKADLLAFLIGAR